MSEAPEEIWTCSHLGEYGRYYPEAVEAEGEHGGTAVKYFHEDHVTAMLKAEREKALREAAETVDRVGPRISGDTILALIEKDATDG